MVSTDVDATVPGNPTGNRSEGLDSSLIDASCSHVAPFSIPPLLPPRPLRDITLVSLSLSYTPSLWSKRLLRRLDCWVVWHVLWRYWDLVVPPNSLPQQKLFDLTLTACQNYLESPENWWTPPSY